MTWEVYRIYGLYYEKEKFVRDFPDRAAAVQFIEEMNASARRGGMERVYCVRERKEG